MPANISLKQIATQAQRTVDEIQSAANILGIPVLNGGQIAPENSDAIKAAIALATERNIDLPTAAQAIAQQSQQAPHQAPGADMGQFQGAVAGMTQSMGVAAMRQQITQAKKKIVYGQVIENLAKADLIATGYDLSDDPELQQMLDSSQAILNQVEGVNTNLPFAAMVALTFNNVEQLRPALPTNTHQVALPAAHQALPSQSA